MCREEVTVERPLAVVVDDLVGLLLEELDGGEALHLGRRRRGGGRGGGASEDSSLRRGEDERMRRSR